MVGTLFQLKFLQKLQNHISKDLDIRTMDITYYINKGVEIFIDEIIDNYKGQEELRKRLGNLVVREELDRATYYYSAGLHTNSEVWALPNDVRHVLDELIELDEELLPVKPVTHDYYNKQIKNPFKTPYSKLIWRMDDGNGYHELIKPNTDTIDNYYLTYIKHPDDIDVTDNSTNYNEIPEGFQNEIIDKAVIFALEVFQIAGSLRATEQKSNV